MSVRPGANGDYKAIITFLNYPDTKKLANTGLALGFTYSSRK
jgi:hypothetical protein